MWRLWAKNAPFDHKDRLRARGYRWSGGDDGRPRAWWVDVDEVGRAGEIAYLQEEIYGCKVEVLQRRITAHDRYSERA